MHEKRRYVRMNTVFPVEFELLSGNGQKSSRGLLQGFTRDVSEGGMCIEYKTFAKDQEAALNLPADETAASDVSLSLTINPTFTLHPIKATASIVWMRQETDGPMIRYWIGVAYQDIDAGSRRRLIHHAQRSLWIPRAAMLGAVVLMACLAFLWIRDQRLISENRRLVAHIQASAEKKSQVSQTLQELREKKQRLDSELVSARETIEQQKIQLELEKVKEGEKTLRDTYRHLQQEDRSQSRAVLKQMFQWLKSHQNLRTGLVGSFEGDPMLEDIAFTYDQSLAAQVFLLFDDAPNAAQILSFYDKRAQGPLGIFFNAYGTSDGRPSESVIHTGPNIWLGIAALQYERRIKDGVFLPLAKRIGDWVIEFQDAEGGLRGGPAFEWYSTEHNLDAYAFLGLLYHRTHDEKYRQAQERVLSWIQKYAYSTKDNHLNRGKGDSTIATDTFSWAIASIGPARLKQIQFDPDAILEFAEKNCQVAVEFRQPDGKISRIQGFDFSKAKHLGRGGVVSAEWTAQMAVGYQVMARYYHTLGDASKALGYRQKADFYLNELQKMVITSPSRTGQGRGCLPYASADNADTGHGWRTPKGATTGSVAATAYGLFAWEGYNPFDPS